MVIQLKKFGELNIFFICLNIIILCRIWYSFAVLIAEYIALFILSTLILKYVRSEVSPPPPIHIADEDLDKESKTVEQKELPFEPIAFSFTVDT